MHRNLGVFEKHDTALQKLNGTTFFHTTGLHLVSVSQSIHFASMQICKNEKKCLHKRRRRFPKEERMF